MLPSLFLMSEADKIRNNFSQHWIAILKEWYLAHDAAKDNPRRLIESRHSEAVTNDCVARMARISLADDALWELSRLSSISFLPAAFQLFVGANADKGCTRCWVSSNPFSKHEDCEKKIKRWFLSQQALMEYIESAYLKEE